MSTTIESLELEIQSNSKSAVDGIEALTKSLNKLKGATKGGFGLSNVSKDVSTLSTSVSKASSSFTDFYHKISAGMKSIQSVASSIKSLVDKSSEYNEVVNLFSTSMGQYAESAYDYATKVNDAMGIDPAEWMKSQGVFMTLATGFGVAGDRAAKMSEQLTQLGYDISSFQDISVEEAMQKLQSGLAGELEPLRRIGYDLSQAKLEATALELGISKSVSSMTQAEKAQLRYYAIMTQVTQQQGDFAKTINDPANQMRLLKSQFEQAGRAIGNIFIPALNAVLPYAIAATKVIAGLANSIAALVGYDMPEVKNTTSAVVESTGAMSENLEDSRKEAKKLKSYMLGIDELNVINPNTESAGEDLSSQFDFELPEYDFMAKLTENKVSEIVEDMKEWLGITGEINSWADLFDTRLGAILITVGAIAVGFGAWKIGAGIYTLMSSLGSLTGISTAFSGISAAATAAGTSIGAMIAPVLAIVAAILAVIAGLTAVYLTNEEVRTSVNNAVKDIGEALTPALTFITETIIPDLKSAWDELIVILTPFGEWLSMVFTSIWMDMIVPALEWVANTVIPTLTSTLENMWNNVFVPLGTFLSSVFTPVISMLSEVLTWLWQFIIVPLADFIGGVFATAWESMMKIFNDVVIPRINRVIEVCKFLWEKVLAPVVKFLWDVFSPAFKLVFEAIGNIITACKEIFSGLIKFVTGVFTKDWKYAWEGVQSIFKGIWDGFKTIIKTPLNYMLTVIEGFVNKIIDGWNWLKQQINSLSIDIPEWLGGGTLGFNLAMSPYVTLPRFAEGGFPAQGQAFIARENGIPEMVGTIGRRTAVANNDQIISGIAGGVAEANEEQNVLLREQNSLLRALLEKDSGVYLDGKNLTNSVEKYQRERGRVLITGGVL